MRKGTLPSRLQGIFNIKIVLATLSRVSDLVQESISFGLNSIIEFRVYFDFFSEGQEKKLKRLNFKKVSKLFV